MNHRNQEAFIRLFKAAFEKCFGIVLQKPLSETEAKHFSNAILEETGLVIGAKSLKNYSSYVLGGDEVKSENPSAATLDTMARYVLNAPFSSEVQRKEKEGHYPYWFTYKSTVNPPIPAVEVVARKKTLNWVYPVFILTAIFIALLAFVKWPKAESRLFIEAFHTVSEDTLSKHGWMLQARDSQWWNKRDERIPGITLYTLRGDNWPDPPNPLGIKNLMLKKLSSDCFSAELHVDSFVPVADWQQAGLLLTEDTTFTGKNVRISIGYNDYFGGYAKPREIILQGVRCGGEASDKPEEVAHIPLFTAGEKNDSLIKNNLRYSAIRIEKNKNGLRVLYSASPVENFAFKEAFAKKISIEPKYIGIFALQGFVNNTTYMPVHISFFSLSNEDCKN